MAEVKEIPVAADAVEAKNIEKKKEDAAENQTNEASSVVATPVVKTLSPSSPMVENKKETVKINPGIVFKIQLMAVSKKILLTADNFKGLSDISTEPVGNLHRYFYGKTPDYKQAKDLLIQAVNAGYLNAFVAAYENGTKISLTKALESLD